VLADDLHLGADDLLAARDQVLDGDLGPPAAPVPVAVEAALLDARQMQNGLTQRLAGDGPGVGAGAAQDAVALDRVTLLPSLAAWIAAFWPAGPLPMTTRSTCFMLAPVSRWRWETISRKGFFSTVQSSAEGP